MGTLRQLAFRATTAALALAIATGGACTVTAGPPPPTPVVVESPTGTLTVTWSIEGGTDPRRCEQARATTIEVTVRSTSTPFVGDYERACALFSTTVTLDVGTYAASAVLIEPPMLHRTTTATIDTFSIVSGEDTDATVDFPAASFL